MEWAHWKITTTKRQWRKQMMKWDSHHLICVSLAPPPIRNQLTWPQLHLRRVIPLRTIDYRTKILKETRKLRIPILVMYKKELSQPILVLQRTPAIKYWDHRWNLEVFLISNWPMLQMNLNRHFYSEKHLIHFRKWLKIRLSWRLEARKRLSRGTRSQFIK